jgi:hypothetical protein
MGCDRAYSAGAMVLLIILQAFHVGFLWLHDWIPLGRLNDVTAVQRQDSTAWPRNGIVPNTLHCLLHLATVAMLAGLVIEG